MFAAGLPAPALVRVVRNGVVESAHSGHVAVCDPSGAVVAALGDAELPTYVRSAVKPFQALAILELLEQAGVTLDVDGLAIGCASHDGTEAHQIEAARLLAEAGLDEAALQCPPALPKDLPTILDQRRPEPLAHNCSGKHAAFLLAHTAIGEPPASYLDTASQLQRRVRDHLAEVSGATPTGPGIDGCGAPAWVLPLRGLATGFARMAVAGDGHLLRVRAAMTARPDLVGGEEAFDTQFMRHDPRVVAKRGAEAVLAAGLDRAGAPVGVAIKIVDGGARADGPVMAAVLEVLG
nr:asparaginase [Euzebyales bacterium]